MADELIEILDAAASEMMAKALEANDLAAAQETFKIIAGWVERKHKLAPAEATKAPTKLSRLQETLHGRPEGGSTRRRRNSASAGEGADGGAPLDS